MANKIKIEITKIQALAVVHALELAGEFLTNAELKRCEEIAAKIREQLVYRNNSEATSGFSEQRKKPRS